MHVGVWWRENTFYQLVHRFEVTEPQILMIMMIIIMCVKLRRSPAQHHDTQVKRADFEVELI